MLAATRTEADYQAWLDQRDWTAWKYRMRDARLPLPAERSEGITRCFCSEVITNATTGRHVRAVHRAIGAMMKFCARCDNGRWACKTIRPAI